MEEVGKMMSTATITAVVTVIPKMDETIPLNHHIIFLKFASSDLDSDGQQKPFLVGEAKLVIGPEQEFKYLARVEVPTGFGEIGAVIVELKDGSTEKFIDNVTIENSSSEDSLTFSCTSWVQPNHITPHHRRIFFSTKSYLPEETPKGLLKLRAEDLANLRGEKSDGSVDENPRKTTDRIYDYDVYNDLGDPEENKKWRRPVLGGSKHPYPRRCRTGRPRCASPDRESEQRSKENFYVPRDEVLSELKTKIFPPGNPKQKNKLGTKSFSHFTQIDLMFQEYESNIPNDALENLECECDMSSPFCDVDEPPPQSVQPTTIQPAAVVPKFPPPEAIKRDKFHWISDRELARQTLAGVNPYCIQLVKSWPLKSELDPDTYGPQESEFTKEIKFVGNFMPVVEAAAQGKLFVLDYHDIFLPYVVKVRSIKGTTLYGSRTLFFLNEDDTLTPLAIELTRPLMDKKPQWKKVFFPSIDTTNAWLWRLAKVHVLAHDSCFHQLIVHWLRTHCCMEPYVIATNRQLSTMHPIYRLLHPHFRFNIRINANARESLINAGGFNESVFSTAYHSMEFSSSMYKEWRFDSQSLPEDLILRGMAEKKEGEPHGLKLAIKDYPFANDGLMLWDALLEWVTEYVNHYYPNENSIQNDKELNAWWTEIKEKGHSDKKNEEGWPALKTPNDLINIVTTIAWVGSGHHAAVNFLQYEKSAYIPSRPSIARINMPTEKFDPISDKFLDNPEAYLLATFPSVDQATLMTRAVYLLSGHSEDEEYIGSKVESAWIEDPIIANAFKKFEDKLKTLESTIEQKNKDRNLKNRRGAGVVPYEVLKPTSTPGVTGKGVPYSVST